MKRFFLLAILLTAWRESGAQNISANITSAFRVFEKDPQLKYAVVSLYVIDAATGIVIFDKNSRVGLAPASTQKIITAATAYEKLGHDFRYSTYFGYEGTLREGKLNGNFYIAGSGDPTLGSWRWSSTNEDSVIARLLRATNAAGIDQYNNFILDIQNWEGETIPDGWIWQDMGNYYGAGAGAFNWRENQYDLILKSDMSLGSRIEIVGTKPALHGFRFDSEATSAAKGTGDRSYIYLPVGDTVARVRGTIPVNEKSFVISGAMPSSQKQFIETWKEKMRAAGITGTSKTFVADRFTIRPGKEVYTELHREISPPLDSISYWFLKKSINLYGEALVKTLALKENLQATTQNGLKVLVDFWKDKNIAPGELNVSDGSGLSPLNRVTTHAQVEVLKYARTRPWFASYFAGFPEYNGMKMKSGTISDVKGFCGYHRSATGQTYIFSFLVNNYNGPSSSVVQKMYRVLDGLK